MSADNKTQDKSYLDQVADSTDEANYLFVKCVVFILFGSILVFACTGESIYQGLIFFLDGITIALLFLLAGGLLGFIFGIPKSLQNASGANGSNARFVTNTSLEQISDWLTKTIVGIGLVEVREILAFIKKLYGFYSRELVCGAHCHECAVYLTALSLLSLLFGFIAFYVYTRVNLSTMFFRKSYDEDKFKDEIKSAGNLNK